MEEVHEAPVEEPHFEVASAVEDVVAESETAKESEPAPVNDSPAAAHTDQTQAASSQTPEPPVQKQERFLVPRPARPVEVRPASSDVVTREPAIVRPPLPERFTPPPASAGMPTFKEVTEAAGAPDISPIEPPDVKPASEDQELKEFVANFRYKPPDESVDELTMRSEVPEIDNEAPAEFHHPSFDGDEMAPQEAAPHPTGEEYYPRTEVAVADRSRFLEIPDREKENREVADLPTPVASTAPSFLALDAAAPPTGLVEEAGPARRHHWGLWSLIAVLLANGRRLGDSSRNGRDPLTLFAARSSWRRVSTQSCGSVTTSGRHRGPCRRKRQRR